jgi:sulfur-oxidizing protein SoxY
VRWRRSAESALAQQSAWNKAAFEAKSLGDVVKALGGTPPAESKDIVITAPDIAENGAVVPVAVASKIPNTQTVHILVEKNPNALAAGFTIPAGTEANIATRIKMGQTSNVYAVVKAGDKYFVASKEIKVTLGGCGG